MARPAPAADRDLLVDVAWLRAALAGPRPPVVLDVRWRLAGPPGRDDYAVGHVPGAVFVDLDTDLAAPVRPDRVGGRHPLPTAEVFQAAMRRAGVRTGATVVAVDDGDGSAAARAWWCLRYFGHDDVRILAGGWRAWVAAGGVVTEESPQVAPGDFLARAGGLPVVDADGAATVAHGAGALVDVRTAVRFRGEHEPVDPVAGHVPGAVNLPAGQVVTDEGWVRPGALRAWLESLGVGDGPIVASCGSGVTAAVLVAALARDGVEAALYPGSWSDWISDASRPVARGE